MKKAEAKDMKVYNQNMRAEHEGEGGGWKDWRRAYDPESIEGLIEDMAFLRSYDSAGRGGELNDHEEAWPSSMHSILSDVAQGHA